MTNDPLTSIDATSLAILVQDPRMAMEDSHSTVEQQDTQLGEGQYTVEKIN